jgi:hypothetical protein
LFLFWICESKVENNLWIYAPFAPPSQSFGGELRVRERDKNFFGYALRSPDWNQGTHEIYIIFWYKAVPE